MVSKCVFQNHPFCEGPRNKVEHITKEKVAAFTYPDPSVGMTYSNINYTYVSTDTFTCTTYDMAPGSRVEPPDYHDGDEVYIVIEGTLTMCNTEAGQVVQIKEGEALLMPRGAKHSGYNFGEVRTRTLAFIAPTMFANQDFPIDELGKMNVYNGNLKPSDFPQYQFCGSKATGEGTIADLGAWPVEGPKARVSPLFHYIPEDRKLLLIAGQNNPALMKVCVSNDYLTVAQIVIPSGGYGARKTDANSHRGDGVIFLPKGELAVLIHDTKETFYLKDEEALFIPKNVTYEMFNYGNEILTAVLCTTQL